MTPDVYWILKAKITDGKLDDLENLAEEFSEMTKTEPGVLAYEWSIGQDRETLHVYERYLDTESAMAHLANVGPHLPRLLELVSITEIQCYGQPGASFREAVKDFPVVYMDTFCGFKKT